MRILTVLLSLVGLYVYAAPTVLLPKADTGLPVTTINLTFRVGAADDPADQAGIAALTAKMLREGGVKKWKDMPARTRAQIEDFLFPYAAHIDVSAEREQTSISVTTSAKDSVTIFRLIVQMLQFPAWDAREFARLKAETLDELSKRLPREDQEDLGKFALDQAIYGKTHPYGHVLEGTVKSVKGLKLEQVKAFYTKSFTSNRLIVGLDGVVSDELKGLVNTGLAFLPQSPKDKTDIPAAPATTGRRLTIVTGPFEATGIHIGQPLLFNRGNPEFAPMYLASIAFGKHRSFVGRLMRTVRAERGLNYGSYAYVEDFPYGGRVLMPPTQVARTRQAFTVWGRPTPLPNGCFLLRQLLREVESLTTEGLTSAEFEVAQSHLVGSLPLASASLERNMGEQIDRAFYGASDTLIPQLEKLKLRDVNAALKHHLTPNNLQIVVVTPDAEKFKEAIGKPRCDIEYAPGIEKGDDVKAEDEKIATYPLHIPPANVRTISAESVFSE